MRTFLLHPVLAFSLVFASVFTPIHSPVQASESSVLIPLFIEGIPQGNLETLPQSGASETRVDGLALLKKLIDQIDPEIFSKIKSSVQKFQFPPITYLTIDALNRAGLVARFDERAAEIQIQIPAGLKSVASVSVSQNGPPNFSNDALVEPAPFSAYLNAHASESYNGGRNGGGDGRQPLRSEFESAFNVHRVVLESNASYTEKAQHPWVRQDVRFVHDDPNHRTRYQAGDLLFPVSGYQSFRPMGGVAGFTHFGTQPYQVTTPVNSREIFLKTPSKVRVLLNGKETQTLFLPAGRHNIRDFPISNGVNVIDLEITDDVGRIEIIRVPYLLDTDLLAPGLSKFTYALGAPSEQNGSTKQYEPKKIVATLSHKVGVTKTFTPGAFIQMDPAQALAGASFTWATQVGTFAAEPAISRVNANAYGYGSRSQYVLTDHKGPDHSQRNFGLGLELRSRRFALLGNTDPNELASHILSTFLSHDLWSFASGNLAFEYNFNRDHALGYRNGYLLSAGLGRGWKNGLNSTLSYTQQLDALGNHRWSVFAFLTFAFPHSGHYATASADTETKTQRATWNYRPPHPIGSLSASAGAQNSPESLGVDADLAYLGNRGTASLGHTVEDKKHSTTTLHTTSLRAAAGLVYVGGRFSVSRPVADSFVLVSQQHALQKEKIELNPQDNGYWESRSDWFGPAVLPELTSYRYTDLNLSLPDVSEGRALERENYTLLPSYKSGLIIKTGNPGAVFLKGQFKSIAQTPLSLVSGNLRSVSEPSAGGLTFFTNRDGRFTIESLKPGTYVFEFFSDRIESHPLEIPQNSEGVYDVGTITVE